MDYHLYHDESKEAGYWHGMLLLPVENKQKLLDSLKKIRDLTNYPDVIGLKKVDKKTAAYLRVPVLGFSWP